MLRPLCKSDAEFLCSIFKDNTEYYNIFFDSETDVVEWERRAEWFEKQKTIHHYIIEEDGRAVGWFSYYEETNRRECGIGILVVKKEFLRNGYGKSALLEFLEICKKGDVHTVYLSVNQDNQRAINFYQRFGFEICGEEIIPQCNEAVNLAQYKMKLHL